MARKSEFAVFGGGCFWCTEAIFAGLRGVTAVTPGYAGGSTKQPTYEQVCAGGTGHAEVVRIEFDPAAISFRELLEVFFALHDPTTRNQQGNDFGEQYRSIVLYADDEQLRDVERFLEQLRAEEVYPRPIVTEVRPYATFYPAEDYHRQYFANNIDKPYCQFVISPKLAKLRQKFSPLVRPTP
ncbi:MAG: peptide-methionine (S)-S-oxide reductase MsrA [bacterium]|nr:peptide-methionine (S)-S-oxide reductase MsrA [bacterium]